MLKQDYFEVKMKADFFLFFFFSCINFLQAANPIFMCMCVCVCEGDERGGKKGWERGKKGWERGDEGRKKKEKKDIWEWE